MTRNGLLTGVTSAAVIWLLAAVGSAIGLGRFGVALAMAVVSVAVLVGIEQLEFAFAALRRGVHSGAEGVDAEDRGPTDPPPPGPRVPPGGSGAPPQW
jgi:putative Mg2+ transporter-C (MgtC) family protein